MHSEKDRLNVANVMAKDFLSLYQGCTYKDLTDLEHENLQRIAKLARQVIDDPNEAGEIEGLTK